MLLCSLLATAIALPVPVQESAFEGQADMAAEYADFSTGYWNAFRAWLDATNAYWPAYQEWQADRPEGLPADSAAYAEEVGPAPVDPSADHVPRFEQWIARGAGTPVEIDARNDLLTILGNQKRFDEWTVVYLDLVAASPTHSHVGGHASSATYVAEQAGRREELHQLLLDVLEEHPLGESAPGILYALAEVYQDDGDLDAARSFYGRLTTDHAEDWYGEQAVGALYELAELQIGMEAPAFDAVTLAGDAISLEDYRGKVVLLDFWATWCGPCLGEMPNVVAAREAFSEDDLVVLAVSLDDDPEKLERFLADAKILGYDEHPAGETMAWPQVCDYGGWDAELAKLYRVKGIPRAYVIDAEGRIAHKDLRGDALQAALEQMIGAH